MRFVRPFLLSGLFGVFAATSATAADTTTVTVQPDKVMTSEVVESATSGGTSALDLIQSARAAIAKQDYAAATRDVSAAKAKLEALHKLNPSASLQDGIRSAQAKLDSDGPEAAASDLAAISDSLTVVDDYADATAQVKVVTEKPRPIGGAASKERIAKAIGYLKQKDVTHARAELEAAYETATYTQVDLPVASSLVSVSEALEALQDGAREGYGKGYAKVADDRLAAAQSRAETIVTVARKAADDLDVAAEPD